jgi:hypothetical protein
VSLVGAGNFLFATDQKNIVTYRADSQGSLTEISSVDGTAHDPDSQYASVQSLSLPADARNLYTDNWFFDGSNNDYESWTIENDGQLTYLGNPGLPLYSTAGGWPFTFSSNGRFGYTWSVCRWDGGVLGYFRRSNGTLESFQTYANGLFPTNATEGGSVCSQGVAISAWGVAAVAWNGDYCCGGPTGIASYLMKGDGTLAEIWGSAIFTTENAMTFDPSGRYLALASALGIRMYQLQTNGRLTPIGAVQQPTVGFTSLVWDNSNHLYALANGLYVFNAIAGQLSLAPGSPYPIKNAGSLAVLLRQ